MEVVYEEIKNFIYRLILSKIINNVTSIKLFIISIYLGGNYEKITFA